MVGRRPLTQLEPYDYTRARAGYFVPNQQFILTAGNKSLGLVTQDVYAKERHELAGKRQGGD